MKNAYAEKMRKMQRDYTISGVQIGLFAITIALNREFGFGKERLLRLQKSANSVINRVFGGDDAEYALTELTEACDQIMKGGDRDGD